MEETNPVYTPTRGMGALDALTPAQPITQQQRGGPAQQTGREQRDAGRY